jgi:putative chitinase
MLAALVALDAACGGADFGHREKYTMTLARHLFTQIAVFFEQVRQPRSSRGRPRRRVIPQVEGPLEERALPAPLPILGVFSGNYSDQSVSDDGVVQNDAGTITLSINSANSGNPTYAIISGSVTITGFAGQDATLLFQTGFEEQDAAGSVSITVHAEDDTIDMGFPGFIDVVGVVQGNTILVRSYNVDGIGGYSTATPDTTIVLTPGAPPPNLPRQRPIQPVTLEQIQQIIPPPTPPDPLPPHPPQRVLRAFANEQTAYNKAIAGYNRISKDLVDYLNSTEALQTYQINTAGRRAAFIGQVAEETAHLTRLTEDTARSPYRGRGLLPLTGKANYAAASKGLGLGRLLVRFPSLVASKDAFAERTAGFFWNRHRLNTLADNGDINGITRRVTGPRMLGAAQRRAFSMTALQVLTGMAV